MVLEIVICLCLVYGLTVLFVCVWVVGMGMGVCQSVYGFFSVCGCKDIVNIVKTLWETFYGSLRMRLVFLQRSSAQPQNV